MRHLESQVLQEEAASEQGSVLAGHSEGGRRAMAPPHAGAASGDMYSFNLSFEELSTAGLEEPRHVAAAWMVGTPPLFPLLPCSPSPLPTHEFSSFDREKNKIRLKTSL